MLKAIVNQSQSFNFEVINHQLNHSGQLLGWHLVQVENGQFHILYKNRSINAEVVEANATTKTFKIRLNKNYYEVVIKDRFDQLLDQLGMQNGGAVKINNIKAPMPGLIVEVKVSVGDVVQKGDTVLILEAMKMENVIKAPANATVRAIKVIAKNNVEKNQVLIEFE